MNKTFVSVTVAGVAFVCGIAALHAQAPTRSSWSGIFTAAQAERGKQLFMDHCAACHGETLAGAEMAPQLAGSEFLSNWNGETLNALTDRIRVTMPADNPGKLSAVSATDIAAFILSRNHMPPGGTDLPRDSVVQAQIRIDALNPVEK
ncbi:MAG TPA: c-type cytochrome [Rhizomicrobium sp.]|nr:c-type cytochrome [Rhizomicrobium sp.]